MACIFSLDILDINGCFLLALVTSEGIETEVTQSLISIFANLLLISTIMIIMTNNKLVLCVM